MIMGELSGFSLNGSGNWLSYATESATSVIDLSIEGMRSQQFSVGVFIFMVVGVLVFAAIIYAVGFSKSARKSLKTGEKVMLGAIILGTILAVIFGGLQLLTGELF